MKKFLSLFLAAAMILCMMPAMAFADEDFSMQPDEKSEAGIEVRRDYRYSDCKG